MNPTFGSIGVQCLLLKNGTLPLKCAVTSCALSTSKVCLTLSLEVYQIQSIRIVSETIIKLLTNQGVDFQYETTINDIQVDIKGATKVARRLLLTQAGKTKEIPLTENDLVFVTNGSITESSTQGDHHTPAPITHELGEVGISGKT